MRSENPSKVVPLQRAESAPAVNSIRVLTVNTHKGFTFFNRRFILPELRDAVRTVGADLLFLQEVLGTHERHAARVDNWPEAPQYEFLADSMWPEFAYGRNAVYPHGHHGNALLSKFPILRYENLDVSIAGPERRGLLHSVLQVPGQHEVHAICVRSGELANYSHRLTGDANQVMLGDRRTYEPLSRSEFVRARGKNE